MSHYVAIRNGMGSSGEDDLSNIAVNFINPGGGVVATNDYLVTSHVSPDNKTVNIGTGNAYIINSAGTMVYNSLLDATYNLTIADNAGSACIDSVVLYIDTTAKPDSSASNVAKFADVRGTTSPPTAGAIATAVGAANPYIVLANVAVASGFTQIVTANISDVRPFAKIGGYFDGWLPANEIWTYASSTTVTTPGDKTGKYQEGMTIKLTQNATVAYFIITAVSYGAPNTTITLDGGSTYTVANAVITLPYYSLEMSPFGFTRDSRPIGYAYLTSNFQPGTTNETDVTGLAVTVTVPNGGRSIKITFWGNIFNTNATASVQTIKIKEGATVLQTIYDYSAVANKPQEKTGFAILTPTAGSHTYKISIQSTSSEGRIESGATENAFILVELI